ncbi:MAG: hypothetical protein V4617_15005 [Gemmatimonadota bacterium]
MANAPYGFIRVTEPDGDVLTIAVKHMIGYTPALLPSGSQGSHIFNPEMARGGYIAVRETPQQIDALIDPACADVEAPY